MTQLLNSLKRNGYKLFDMNELLEVVLTEFIDWARDCGEDAWFIFDEPHEAISRFIEYKSATDFDEE